MVMFCECVCVCVSNATKLFINFDYNYELFIIMIINLIKIKRYIFDCAIICLTIVALLKCSRVVKDLSTVKQVNSRA